MSEYIQYLAELIPEKDSLKLIKIRYPILIPPIPLNARDKTDRKTICVSLPYCRTVRYRESRASTGQAAHPSETMQHENQPRAAAGHWE